MELTVSIQPSWPTKNPKPAADVWYQWKQTFPSYVGLLPSMNNAAPLTEILKPKLLGLYLGELGRSYYDARRLNKQSSLEDALKQLTKLWGSQDNIFAARHRFQLMRQLPNETVDAVLKRL